MNAGRFIPSTLIKIDSSLTQEDAEDLSRRLAEQEELVNSLRSDLRASAEDEAALSEKKALQTAELAAKVEDQREEIRVIREQASHNIICKYINLGIN